MTYARQLVATHQRLEIIVKIHWKPRPPLHCHPLHTIIVYLKIPN